MTYIEFKIQDKCIVVEFKKTVDVYIILHYVKEINKLNVIKNCFLKVNVNGVTWYNELVNINKLKSWEFIGIIDKFSKDNQTVESTHILNNLDELKENLTIIIKTVNEPVLPKKTSILRIKLKTLIEIVGWGINLIKS